MKTLRSGAWIAILGLAAAYAGHWYSQRSSTSAESGAVWSNPFSMVDIQGKTHQLADYRGQLLLINFWATWCSPCMEELPLLVEAQTQFGPQGLRILGPAMDELEPVQKVMAQMGVNYPVFQDYTQIDTTLRAFGNHQGALPYSVLISRDGKVLETLLGGLNREQLQTLLKKHLGS